MHELIFGATHAGGDGTEIGSKSQFVSQSSNQDNTTPNIYSQVATEEPISFPDEQKFVHYSRDLATGYGTLHAATFKLSVQLTKLCFSIC